MMNLKKNAKSFFKEAKLAVSGRAVGEVFMPVAFFAAMSAISVVAVIAALLVIAGLLPWAVFQTGKWIVNVMRGRSYGD